MIKVKKGSLFFLFLLLSLSFLHASDKPSYLDKAQQTGLMSLQKTLSTCLFEQPIINVSRLYGADSNFSLKEFYRKNGLKGFWMTWKNTAAQCPSWFIRLGLIEELPGNIKTHVTPSPYFYPALTALPLGASEILATAQKRLAILNISKINNGNFVMGSNKGLNPLVGFYHTSYEERKKMLQEMFKGWKTDVRGNIYSWATFLYGLEWYERGARSYLGRPLNSLDCALVGIASGVSCSFILSTYNYILVNIQKVNPEKNLGSDWKNFKALIKKNGWRPYLTVLMISLVRSGLSGASTKIVLGPSE